MLVCCFGNSEGRESSCSCVCVDHMCAESCVCVDHMYAEGCVCVDHMCAESCVCVDHMCAEGRVCVDHMCAEVNLSFPWSRVRRRSRPQCWQLHSCCLAFLLKWSIAPWRPIARWARFSRISVSTFSLSFFVMNCLIIGVLKYPETQGTQKKFTSENNFPSTLHSLSLMGTNWFIPLWNSFSLLKTNWLVSLV